MCTCSRESRQGQDLAKNKPYAVNAWPRTALKKYLLQLSKLVLVSVPYRLPTNERAGRSPISIQPQQPRSRVGKRRVVSPQVNKHTIPAFFQQTNEKYAEAGEQEGKGSEAVNVEGARYR